MSQSLNVAKLRKVYYPKEIPFGEIPVVDFNKLKALDELINKAKDDYQHYKTHSRDIQTPEVPRLKMNAQGLLYRIPDSAVLNIIIHQNFKEAQVMGFKGRLDSWKSLIQHELLP